MKKTVVINVVGLTAPLIQRMPFLSSWSQDKKIGRISPVFPAVTCSAQAVYMTGTLPSDNGIVGNGWYSKETSEVKFWQQSHKLIGHDALWDEAKRRNPNFTSAVMFWWFNMYSTTDYSVTPRPQYRADGQKVPDCYSYPPELRDTLQKKLGTFPLFDFWGPRTSIRSSRWIAQASMETDSLYDPTLSLIYIPHLDYALQRVGPHHPSVEKDILETDNVLHELITYFESKGTDIIILSEYGITEVDTPVHVNRILREQGLLKVRIENGRELLDAGASDAFAVADHQVAHVYVTDERRKDEVRRILEKVPGIEKVLDKDGKRLHGIDHERAGDLVAISTPRSWFTYYYWLDDRRAPDFARLVEIHKKPGYDPAELFIDPSIRFPRLKVILKLLRKKLGFRTLMDVIPLDAKLVRGSHGRKPESKDDYPVIITKGNVADTVEPTHIRELILKTIFNL